MAADKKAEQPLAYYGGQAVIEGVMMRGTDTWAVAVRRPSGEIYLERHRTSDFPKRVRAFSKPMLRGMFALVDALRVGTKALSISAVQSAEEDERMSATELGGSLVMALVLFVAVFVLLPNVGLAPVRGTLGDGVLYHVVEGIVRVALFLGYLAAIALMGDIRRVFAYHGAEHQTIAAWEHGQHLEPETVGGHSTFHVRCGTNFLIMVMLIAIVVYSVAGVLVPPPAGGALTAITYHTLLRIVLLPVVAGLAYEGLRLGAGTQNWLVRVLMQPGLWLQRITTRPPEDGMAEVAIRAFQAVVPAAELAGRVTDELPSPIVWGPDETTPQPADEPDEGEGERQRAGGRGDEGLNPAEEPTSGA